MAVLGFQMPEKVVMEKADDFHGLFEFKPLEPGYGVTIGNALRRVLLSSLEGYAIVGIRIPSVLHEFSTMEGVVEDVSEIILNLKMVCLKRKVEEPTLKFSAHVKGKNVITAGDLGINSSDFTILNPDLVICHLDESVEFEIDLFIDRGKGYVPAEENKPATEMPIGYIPIDAIYTPIKNVRYSIENTRVEQRTDYEKLLIEIKTDGSIHPEEALKSAAHLLIKHLLLISDQNITLDEAEREEQEAVDEEMLYMRRLLKSPLSELDLSVRAYNCLKAANIKTLGDLVSLEISDMMKFRNFGKKSLTELEQLVNEKGLTFGMDVSKYRLDED
ncbi:DNA-directed RNA polymerase subunit alpha [Hugenholtzia roseola]|uniref:DNA-directed RNA polymerase subunit alpha n=1 Tax=Hugenholtzia roseola TaxID=1002 RepID=UPI00047C2F53|nr:DNA-directed RNA polymerase subunit alpha [Hugenholtzia roseola]